jgi:glycosyltransferase involved in cell wall biosynthesis
METNNKPEVSVIIPTYNRANIISRAIRSVLAQTYENFEIIIIDDGSTDNTEEVIQSFSERRIRYLRHKVNRGRGTVRNKALTEARGEYIAFLDDDDEWLPTKLERQLQVFKTSDIENLGLVLCGMTVIGSNFIREWCPPQRGWMYEYFLSMISLGISWLPCWLVKKNLVTEVGPFDNLSSGQDIDWLLRASKLSQIDFIPESLVVVHQESGYDPNSTAIRRLNLTRKYAEELNQRPQLLQSCYIKISQSYHKQRNSKEARHYLVLAIKAYPLTLRPYIQLLLASFMGPRYTGLILNFLHDIRQTFRLLLSSSRP